MALKGLTPEALAREAGLSAPTVYKALKGEALRPGSASRIMVALGRIPAIDLPDDLVRSA